VGYEVKTKKKRSQESKYYEIASLASSLLAMTLWHFLYKEKVPFFLFDFWSLVFVSSLVLRISDLLFSLYVVQ
jgi:hypothetical protein